MTILDRLTMTFVYFCYSAILNMKKTQHIPQYKKAAKALGLSVSELKIGSISSKTLYIKGNGKICIIAPKETGFYPQTSRWFSVLANSKILSEQILKDLGYKTVSSVFFDISTTANQTDLKKQLQKKCKTFPIIIKPEYGNKGKGIRVIKNLKELQIYGRELYTEKRSFMVQKIVFGTEYRVLILNKKVYVVHAKEFPHIVGDGVHTIAQMLKNEDQTKVDTNFLTAYLRQQGLTTATVIPKGEKVPFNITRKGSFSYYKSKKIPTPITQWAKELCKDLSSPIVGVDVFIPDDFSKFENYRIIEVNASPGFGYLADRYKEKELVETICKDVLAEYFNIAQY